jgi:hypothetical protein
MKWVLKCSNRANCKFAQDDRWLESSHYVLKYDRKRKRTFPASDEEVGCPVCGEPLRWEEQTVPISDFGVSTFNGLSDEAKKKVLRERFDADNRRTGDDIKTNNHRRAVEKMIGYDKQ